MHCTVECLVRGSGKIFLLLHLTPHLPVSNLRITATTKRGAPSAALLFPYDEGPADPVGQRVVAVLPQLDCDQTVELIATDDAGRPVATDQLMINPADAKWRSRLNYRVHRDLAFGIRDYDDKVGDDSVVLELTESFPHTDLETVRGTLTVATSFTEPLAVEVLDRDGTAIEGAFTLLGDTVIDDGRPEFAKRELSFTLRVPQLCNGMILRATDPSGLTRGRFLIVDGTLIQRVRDLGYVRMVNASWDPLYDEWFLSHRLTERQRLIQRETTFRYEPLISVVVPLYKTPLAYFYELIEALERQTYRHWELVLVNATPEDQELTVAVEEVAALDPAITVVPLTANQGIAANTNAGIRAAQGEFIGLMDHDDLIEPDTLYEYVRALNANPDLDLLYSDEDLLLEDGRFTRGYFKPDFSIDLLRANNYVSHFLVLRKTLLEACGLLSSAYDGAQDHDLVLHASELTDAIYHVRKPLYHWRVNESSTAGAATPKDYASAAGIAAVQAHLDRCGLAATVERGPVPFTYDVHYTVAEPRPLVSIIIPNKDGAAYLERCIRSITALTSYDPYEIVIVENNSVEEATFTTYEALKARDERVRVVTYDGSFNFSKIINYGATQARGDYFVLLNNDTELLCGDWLERMVGLCQRPDVGAVGVKLLYPDRTIQHEGVALLPIGPSHINLFLPDTRPDEDHVLYMSLNVLPQERSAVTGACMAVSRSAFETVGGFDESFAVAYNDVDFCLRLIERGLKIVYTPQVSLIHYESVTRGYEDTPEKRLRHRRERIHFDERWIDYFIDGDPYYNAALFQDNQYYQLKW